MLTDKDFEDLAKNFVGGLAEQANLQHKVDTSQSCGKYWTGYFNSHGVWVSQPVLCGQCEACLQRKAAAVEKRVLRRIEKRKEENDALVVSLLLNVSETKIMALQKRLQRDASAEYYHAHNEGGGHDYIIQATKNYGEVTETLEYDFALAAKVSKRTGKRQTGLLYSTKSKKVVAETEDTYQLRMTKITAVKLDDSKRITAIAKSVKPTEYAHTREEHQARIFGLTTRLTSALDEAGIKYRTEGLTRRVRDSDRLKYNANVVECPNRRLLDTDSIGAYLDKQASLFDAPQPIKTQYALETTLAEDQARQIELCWTN